jgi:DNA repair protein RecO (recombination protein O)
VKLSERQKTVEAVIIAHKDFGEADRLVILFSREGGKIKALAKGVRKISSRKAAYLEPFMHSKVVLARGKTFWIITQADAIKSCAAIRDSLKKTGQAAYIMELVDRFTVEEEPDHIIFRLLVDTLNQIAAWKGVSNALRYFELKLLDRSGFRPDLTKCVGCGKEISAQDQFFSTPKGGVLCPDCGGMHNRARGVTMDALRFLRHYQRSGFSEIINLKVPSAVQKEIAAVMNKYISGVLERKLNAPEFIKKVNRLIADDHQVQ